MAGKKGAGSPKSFHHSRKHPTIRLGRGIYVHDGERQCKITSYAQISLKATSGTERLDSNLQSPFSTPLLYDKRI